MSFFNRLFGGAEKQEPQVEKRTLLNLRVGDFVAYDLIDYEVTGKIHYNDSGYTWDAYQLASASKTIWLSVEMDDELEVGIYEKSRVPGIELGTKKIMYDERPYFLEEQGRAYVQGEGRSQNVNGTEMDYYEYVDESGEYFLSVEVWGGEVEVSHGYEIEEFEVTILAGS
ncbi:DUF4178 domain-containing protein [Planomicrobium sp. CPCC 101079]|uniref:DUF4178 domain-containing protein n=1 Tax=Planomicrobium sp. CPCC 101079 TaxID=2599618 RepID=UPI0011B57D37|nr:DUF4178 domain-containing protein [Planomicrobium sp. CPCC 101079]TWT00523.1 DUF4178 domain-containing protein [Planomicrobium sp. CPCC 101079]